MTDICGNATSKPIVWDHKPNDPEQPIEWVELKTAAEITDQGSYARFERKMLKFWAQSFLLGVPRIIVGFRDQAGVLRRLEELKTHQLPGRVKRDGMQTWDGNLCTNCAASVLSCESYPNSFTGHQKPRKTSMECA